MSGPVRQCAILVGGAGTRLGDIARDLPKPLLPVAGRPFLEWLLIKAAGHGLERVLLLAGHKAGAVFDYLAASGVAARLGLDIAVSVEPEPLGTAGALGHAINALDQVFILVNGDTWFDFDWSALGGGEAFDAMLSLRSLDHPDRYETVALDGTRVTGFVPRGSAAGPALINGGTYLLRRRVFEGLSGVASLENDFLPRLCAQGRLGGKVFEAPFIDIGIPADYAAAQSIFAAAGG